MAAESSNRVCRRLTGRGHTMLGVGVAIVIVTVLAGQHDVMRIGMLLIALPVLSLIMVSVARLRLSSARSVVPDRAPLGSPMVGRVGLSLESRLPVGMVMLEDHVPAELGQQPRFTIDRPGVNWQREVEYPLLGRVRGRWHCGPLAVRTTDPFGLVVRQQQFELTTEVLVTPQVVPLTPLPSSGGSGSSGESQPHRIGVVGADDVLIREYRHGDDVRRVHWRSTAKRGELMVRREEQAWDPAARIILDSRSRAHAGTGIYSSLEWAVSAAASIGIRFLQDSYRIELYESDGPLDLSEVSGLNQTASADLLVSRLTDLQPRRTYSMQYGLEAAAAEQGGELVVAILGRVSSEDAHALLRTRKHRTGGLAFLLDVDDFARSRAAEDAAGPAGGASARTDNTADLTATAELLSTEGWRVVQVSRSMTVADAWAQAAGGPAIGTSRIVAHSTSPIRSEAG
jgi:uncharacterized protein (DUF58 family)